MNAKRAATLKRKASKHLPRTRSATALTQKRRAAALVKARAARGKALSTIKSKSKSKSRSKSRSGSKGGFMSFF